MKNVKRNVIVSAVLAIALCISVIAGATFAMFTSTSKVSVAVTAGKVSVTANAMNFKTWSGEWNDETQAYDSVETSADKSLTASKGTSKSFANGGWVYKNDAGDRIALHALSPMDKITFDINIQNNSNVAVNYRTIVKASTDKGLFSALKITIGGEVYNGFTAISDWQLAEVPQFPGDSLNKVTVSIELPEATTDEYQGKECEIEYAVEAVQANAHVENPDRENEIDIYTVTDLMSWGKSVKDGVSYAGKTVKLMNSISFYNTNIVWNPVDLRANNKGLVIDGNGKTISFMTINGTYGGYGFGFIKSTAAELTVKNLTFRRVTVNASYSNVVGVVMGYTYAKTNFDNVVVDNCSINGFGKVGALVGMAANPGVEVNIKNCKSTNNTFIGGYNMGGLIGLYQRKLATNEEIVTIDNVNVENNTVQLANDSSFANVTTTINTTVSCADGAASTCIGNGTAIIGLYRKSTSGYYFGYYADYYVSYGAASHDCATAAGYNIANSEICRNK